MIQVRVKNHKTLVHHATYNNMEFLNKLRYPYMSRTKDTSLFVDVMCDKELPKEERPWRHARLDNGYLLAVRYVDD